MRHATMILLALAATLSTAAPARADSTRAEGLTVVGSAMIAVSPDCADLGIQLATRAADPAAAIKAVQAQQATLVAALAKLGVTGADVTLSALSVSADYRYVNERNVLDGYWARISITATTRVFDQIAPLMDASARAGATQMTSRFRHSNLDPVLRKLRAEALLAARATAKDTAATLGITLGRVIAISDASRSNADANAYVASSRASGGGLGGEVQLLTAQVEMTYALSPRE